MDVIPVELDFPLGVHEGLSDADLSYSRSILEWVPYVKRRNTNWTIERQAFFIARPINPLNDKYSEASDVLLTNAKWITESNDKTGPRFLANFKRDYLVVFVDRNLQFKPVEIDIVNVIIHPEYRGKINDTNDIAMIKLKRPVIFSRFLQPIEPSKWNIADVSNCTLTGWNMRYDYDNPDQTSETGKTIKTYYAGAVANASNVRNVEEGHLESSIQNIGDGKPFWTSTGAPLICKKDDRAYAQGLMTGATLVDLSAQYAWIMDTLYEIDTPKIFHSNVSTYALSLHQPVLPLNSSYIDHWYAKSIYEKVIIEKGHIGIGCLRDITVEERQQVKMKIGQLKHQS
uniref:Peptidase S1 domain-containing protein n=1 Tax=Romanomermis culicivorax TaxID=13658 RepID=A0A915I1J1_ROMCU